MMASAQQALRRAIALLGGQVETAKVVYRSQGVVSEWLNDRPITVLACLRIEIATGGNVTAVALRPDLADVFREFRQSKPQQDAA